MLSNPTEKPSWVFLSNHGYVLLTIARDPTLRLRDIASAVGITERATIRIVRQLVEEGYLQRHRLGRRNVYRVDPRVALRHPAWRDREVGLLLALARRVPADPGSALACLSTVANGSAVSAHPNATVASSAVVGDAHRWLVGGGVRTTS